MNGLSNADLQRLGSFTKKKEQEEAEELANRTVIMREIEGLAGLIIRLGLVPEEKKSDLVKDVQYVIDSYKTRKCTACDYKSTDCK